MKQLRQFLGLVNFYHRFIPNCAHIVHPLHTLLKANELIWNEEASKAFENIKICLAKATMLSHPKLGAPTFIMSDAFNTAVGAVLQQFVDGVWHPISYFSHKLSPAETKYSTFDRELLAIYIWTDHKPLTFLFPTNSNRYLPHQARQLDFISQFTTDIRHMKGSNNPVADALSRVDINALQQPNGVDFTAMAIAQQTDPELLEMLQSSLALNLIPIPLSTGNTSLICDTSTAEPCPYVPASFRRAVFDSLHSLSCPCIKASQKFITSWFVWPRINKDFRQWAQSCLICQ